MLYNAEHKRFVDELLPRDLLSAAIRRQMELDHKPYVWLSMEHIPQEEIKSHFPNIYQKCLEEGYDVTKECIPVVPAQHYFMGGIWVDRDSRTSMEQLYAVGRPAATASMGPIAWPAILFGEPGLRQTMRCENQIGNFRRQRR